MEANAATKIEMSENEMTVFAYDNYRLYLKNIYHSLKARDKKFSYRYFARVAGFKSQSFLKLVIDGRSNLSLESIEKFSRALKHSKAEELFFTNLVLLNQSTNFEDKKIYAEHILKSRGYREIHPINEPLYHYLSKWYFLVIKEMVGISGFRENHKWISQKLGSDVPPSEVKKAIDEMLTLGIIGRNDQGKLYQIKTFVMTADEVVSSSAADYHREMMRKASSSIDLVARQKRELSGLTLSISKQTADKIKNMIQQFRKDIMMVCAHDEHADSVYQVNLHLFPLVETDEEENKE